MSVLFTENQIEDLSIQEYIKTINIDELNFILSKSVIKERMNREMSKIDKSVPAFIIYTSGSTGEPKGVIVSHENILFTTEKINDYLKINKSDRILSYLDVSFDYGLYQIFLCVSSGATLFLEKITIFPGEIQRKIIKNKITGLPGIRHIFNLAFLTDSIKYTSLRFITNTGDTVNKNLLKKIRKKSPNADIFLMYGLTECKRVSILPPSMIDIKPNSVGIPLDETNVSIIHNGKKCRAYEVGELYVEGKHLCLGYINDEHLTKDTYVNINNKRMLKTGDLFYQDEDGYLYFCGRKDGFIKSNGYRIDPLRIENLILSKLYEVIEVAIVGLPDELYGNKLAALISLDLDKEIISKEKTRITDSILDICTKFLDPWYKPHIIELTSERLPVNANGKINKQKIKERFSEKMGV